MRDDVLKLLGIAISFLFCFLLMSVAIAGSQRIAERASNFKCTALNADGKCVTYQRKDGVK